jgi:hypothetical protein
VTTDRIARRSPATRQARRVSGLRKNSAAASGAGFVSNGRVGASMAMAILTGVALLCYLANLLVVGPPAAITQKAPGN